MSKDNLSLGDLYQARKRIAPIIRRTHLVEALKLSFQDAGYNLEHAELHAQKAFDVFHAARQQVTFFEHTLSVLNQLKKDYQLAALTNGNADISMVGLGQYFDFALSADLVGKQKPEPDMFLMALDRANVRADEAIHIGDHQEQDILAAQYLGFHTIWANFEPTLWQHEVTPTAIAHCLSEIPALITQITNDSF